MVKRIVIELIEHTRRISDTTERIGERRTKIEKWSLSTKISR